MLWFQFLLGGLMAIVVMFFTGVLLGIGFQKRKINHGLSVLRDAEANERSGGENEIFTCDIRANSISASWKLSKSQEGEDLICKRLLRNMYGVERDVRYLDIGCFLPNVGSNTFLFYQEGGRGVIVDANPSYKLENKRLRPHDVFLNKGIVGKADAKELVFYDFCGEGQLSTFSRERADAVKEQCKEKYKEGKVKERIIPVIEVNDLLKECFSKGYFIEGRFDLLSIDVEGMDLEILHEWNFNQKGYRPKLIIMEANKVELSYTSIDIVVFMEAKGYILLADTWINFIFGDRSQMVIKPNRQYYDFLLYKGVKL